MASFLTKLNFKRIFWMLFSGFCLLFIYRFITSFSQNTTAGRAENEGGQSSFFDSQNGLRKNYASEKKWSPQTANFPTETNQKYEKTASLTARSTEFENEERVLRGRAKSFDATIQYENKSGNVGNRMLHLMIGVKPELFDSFYLEIQKTGIIYQNSITKIDKTTEFRELNGKRVSLEKALSSLNDLKNRAGTITDLVGLHEKILDVERQMQELGVELGNFSAENEFCTVRFSLSERVGGRMMSMTTRIFRALEWSIQKYFIFLVSLLLLTGVAWVLSFVLKSFSENNLPNVGEK
jgi:Domain of unknown function (DUF4349)